MNVMYVVMKRVTCRSFRGFGGFPALLFWPVRKIRCLFVFACRVSWGTLGVFSFSSFFLLE